MCVCIADSLAVQQTLPQHCKATICCCLLSLFTFMHWRRKWQRTPVFLPGESQRQGSLVGCRLWGRTESDTTEATQQHQQQQSLSGIQLFCDPMDCGLPGSSVHGILQVRTLEWVAIPDPVIKLGSLALADRFFTTEHQESPCKATILQ